LINVYFCEKPIIDFFQNAEYEKELQYYGINEKDFITVMSKLKKI
ncbi:spore coat protein CotS, partial [Campylobacter coli]|nr:spore coat protein CotS [Campylobacter coli]